MLLDLLEPPGRCSGCWPHDGEVDGCAVEEFWLRANDGARAFAATADATAAAAGRALRGTGYRQTRGIETPAV